MSKYPLYRIEENCNVHTIVTTVFKFVNDHKIDLKSFFWYPAHYPKKQQKIERSKLIFSKVQRHIILSFLIYNKKSGCTLNSVMKLSSAKQQTAKVYNSTNIQNFD